MRSDSLTSYKQLVKLLERDTATLLQRIAGQSLTIKTLQEKDSITVAGHNKLISLYDREIGAKDGMIMEQQAAIKKLTISNKFWKGVGKGGIVLVLISAAKIFFVK